MEGGAGSQAIMYYRTSTLCQAKNDDTHRDTSKFWLDKRKAAEEASRPGGFPCSTFFTVVHVRSLVTKMVHCMNRGVFIWSTSLPRVRRCTLSGAQRESFTALPYG